MAGDEMERKVRRDSDEVLISTAAFSRLRVLKVKGSNEIPR